MSKKRLFETVVRVAVPSAFAFMLGNGIQAIMHDRAYAVTQTTVAVSGLGLYYKRRFEPSYKKTKRRLDKLFKNSQLTRNDIVWCHGWRVKSNRLLKEMGKLSFELQEEKDYIYQSAQDFFSELLRVALRLNMEKGYGIRESVLNAVCISIDKYIPFLKEQKTITDYIKENKTLYLLMLHFSLEILKNTMQAKSDEQVLDFLNKGIEDPKSLFYGIDAKDVVPLFFNQKPYQQGDSTFFKIMSAGTYTSLAGAVASTCCLPTAYNLGMFAISGGIFYTNYLLRKKHFLSEYSRFLSPCFNLKSIEPKKMATSVLDDKISWVQNETFLTSYGRADINLNVLNKIKKVVETMPVSLSKNGKEGYLKTVLIGGNKTLSQCYNGLQGGLTLEEGCQKFGVSSVYEVMQTIYLIEKLKTLDNGNRTCMMFELKCLESDFEKQLHESKNEMDSLGIYSLESFFEHCFDFVTRDEKRKLYKELSVDKTVKEHVLLKLPIVIKKMQKETKSHVRD